MYLIFDTETTGLPLDFSKPISDFENWGEARCVQLAWQLHDENGILIEASNDIIKPNGFEIPLESIAIHGVSSAIANKHGISIEGSTIYVTAQPCFKCFCIIANSGIEVIYYKESYGNFNLDMTKVIESTKIEIQKI